MFVQLSRPRIVHQLQLQQGPSPLDPRQGLQLRGPERASQIVGRRVLKLYQVLARSPGRRPRSYVQLWGQGSFCERKLVYHFTIGTLFQNTESNCHSLGSLDKKAIGRDFHSSWKN